MTRYALYFAPAATHPLWQAGREWLGRDPESGWAGPVGGRRAEPRRYGFHATLKPPFALRDDVDEAALAAQLSAFAAERAGFDMPALHVAPLGDFLALRPRDGDAAPAAAPLRALADDCVRDFDALRRPATPAEAARRRTADLTARQREHVDCWGYPHVFDHWRFHMTLTDSLPRGDAGEALHRALAVDAERHFGAALALPLRCDGVALFVEDAPGADFRLARRFGFAR